MNYPEELREKWNECMYDERDIIQKFLEKQYDIRYGRQRNTWHFEPAVRLIGIYGCEIGVTDARLDKNKFVTFTGVCCNERNDNYECTDFAYGELSKVIETLPNADEIARQNAIYDLVSMCKNVRVNLLLNGGFSCKIGEHNCIIDDVITTDEELQLVHAGCADCSSEFPTELLTKLRDHIHIEVLHRSNEYKELMELLSLEENMRFECQNYGDATFVIDGTDMTFDISSVRRDDKGCLVIYGNDIDADVCDNIELTEKDIKPQYLTSIIECMKPKYTDIVDTYNGHNPELVRKINDAWKNPNCHDRFGDILFALGSRDKQEIQDKFDIVIDCNETAMDNAHEIMEGVCDDLDLETILNFIRYEED